MFRALGQIVADFVGYVIDLWTGFINGIIDAANFLLGGINKVIGAVGKFIGIESEINLHLERVDSSQFKQNVEMSIENTFDTAAKYTQEFDVNKFKESLNVGGIRITRLQSINGILLIKMIQRNLRNRLPFLRFQ